MANGKCPIWGTFARDEGRSLSAAQADSHRTAGRYDIGDRVGAIIQDPTRVTDQEKARLTTWLVDQRRLGVDCPQITSEIVSEMKRRAPMPVHGRADRLLAFLAKKSKTIGSFVILSGPDRASHMYPTHEPSEATTAAWQAMAITESVKWEEISFLANYLKGTQ